MPNAPGRTTARATTSSPRARRSSTATRSTFALDGRLNSRLNVFGRYSYAKFAKDGPSAFGAGGGPGCRGPGRQLEGQEPEPGPRPRLHALADVGARRSLRVVQVQGRTCSRSTTARTRPLDAGHPGLNFPDDAFTSGLPRRLHQRQRRDDELRHGARGPDGSLQLPAGPGREAVPVRRQPRRRCWAPTTPSSSAIDVRRAYNLRVPSDNHRSGEIDFNADGHPGAGRRRPRPRHVPARATSPVFARYVSTSTDAREAQWRWFVYAQDTWRPNRKLTINYGLRLDDIMPQTINEAGNGGCLDIDTGEMMVGRASAASR